jgi:hypothetical protein
MTERQAKQLFFLDMCDCGLTVNQDQYCLCSVRDDIDSVGCEIQTIKTVKCIT